MPHPFFPRMRWTLVWISGFALALAACSSPTQTRAAPTVPLAVAAPLPSSSFPPTFTLPLPTPTVDPTPTPNPPTPTPVAPQHRIGVRTVNGEGEFLDRATGLKFVPRGANYIRLAATVPPCVETGAVYHSTFNVGLYDADAAERALASMQAQGYNTVRVFLNHLCIVNANGRLSAEYLLNLSDFLRRAKTHGLVVIIAIDDPPGPGYRNTWQHAAQIDWANRSFLQSEGIEVEERFWSDLIHALVDLKAPTDTILAYSLRNEMSYLGNVPPFSLSSGLVTTGNGKSYDVADAQARQAMMDDNLVFWIDRTRARILEVDPTALVTVGFFVPQSPHPARNGDPRLTRALPAITRSSTDFVDLHPYPGQGLTLEQYVDNFELPPSGKPILMGEFGATKQDLSTASAVGQALAEWQIESCRYGFDGWLQWTWDLTEDHVFWTGIDEGGAINRWLAPATRPDACAPGTRITLTPGPIASDGTSVVEGKLSDAGGQPIPFQPITFSAKPLDGAGISGISALEDIVPAGAVQAVAGLRVNLECNGCRGAGELALYNVSFTQGDDPGNRVPNGNFDRGVDSWGNPPDAPVRVEPSDRGNGRMLQVNAAPNQTVMLNSGSFPVNAGDTYRLAFEARVAPQSSGSGYWAVFFLGVNGNEVQRRTIPLEPAVSSTSETRTDANGTFQLTWSGLGQGHVLIRADYAGDDKHLPGHTQITLGP